MRKLPPLSLAACLGIAAVSMSVSARAGIVVGVPVPGVIVAPPLVTPWPYAFVGPRRYYPGLVRYGYGFPYVRGYGHRPGYGRWARGWGPGWR